MELDRTRVKQLAERLADRVPGLTASARKGMERWLEEARGSSLPRIADWNAVPIQSPEILEGVALVVAHQAAIATDGATRHSPTYDTLRALLYSETLPGGEPRRWGRKYKHKLEYREGVSRATQFEKKAEQHERRLLSPKEILTLIDRASKTDAQVGGCASSLRELHRRGLPFVAELATRFRGKIELGEFLCQWVVKYPPKTGKRRPEFKGLPESVERDLRLPRRLPLVWHEPDAQHMRLSKLVIQEFRPARGPDRSASSAREIADSCVYCFGRAARILKGELTSDGWNTVRGALPSGVVGKRAFGVLCNWLEVETGLRHLPSVPQGCRHEMATALLNVRGLIEDGLDVRFRGRLPDREGEK